MANSFYEHSGYPPGSRARNSSQKLRAEFSAIEAGAQAIETAIALKADAADVSEVDNTSDADKPISTLAQAALALKADAADVSEVDNTSDADKPISTLTQAALALKADAADVSEVDNTSDADKPISTLTQAALDLKADYSALVDFNPATAGADKMLVTNATGDGWEYPSITAAGKALLAATDAAAQRATLGIRASPGKNLLINGGPDIWQRGTSFTATGTYYTADRWEFVNGPGGGSVLKSPVVGPLDSTIFLKGRSPVSAIVLNYTATGDEVLRTKVEDVGRFSNSTLTLSFWALDTLLLGGVAIDIRVTQNFGTGGSPSSPDVLDNFNPVSLTGIFERYTFTFTLPTVQGKALGSNNDSFIMIELVPVKPPSNKAVTICDVQLEFGGTATDFEYRHPAEELALCQRYYETGSDGIPKVANMLSSDTLRANAIPFKVTKRRVPDMTIGALTPSGHDGTPGTINATYPSTDEFCSQWNWTGGTAGRAVSAQFTWIADAEL